MPDLNIIDRYTIHQKHLHGLILQVETTSEMLEENMVGVGIDFVTPADQNMECPVDKSFGFVDKDSGHSMLFFFDGLNNGYKPIGFSGNTNVIEFDFPLIVA